MIYYYKIISISFLFLFLSNFLSHSQPRQKISLNSNWYFVLNDWDRGLVSETEGQKLRPVRIPHTWNAADIIDEVKGYHRGIGWYQNRLFVGEEWRNKNISLYFEGVCNKATVYVNEQLAGIHNGCYTGFKFLISSFLKYGSENVIHVKVNNEGYLSDSIPPFSGDFSLMGGIYRDVWMEITEPVRIVGDHGSNGIRFFTQSVNEKQAAFRIITSLKGIQKNFNGVLKFGLIHNGRIRQAGEKKISLNADGEIEFSGTLSNPALWSPETPELYTLQIVLRDDKQNLVDEQIVNVGFRWFELAPDRSFKLNGKPYKLKGASRHQDYQNIGSALTDDLHWNDIRLMKEMGCNFIRIAHYPQDPAIYEACDKLGLISWSEIPVVDRVVDSEAFHRNSEIMMKEMILQNINHPSVVMWGFHNEVRNLDKATIENAQRLNKISKDLDPDRLTAMAFETNFDNGYFQNPLLNDIMEIPDIIGYNVYEAWYRGTLQNVFPVLQTLDKIAGQKPFMLSEYGAGSSTDIHTSQPAIFDFSEEYQCLFNEAYLDGGIKFTSMIGWGIWNFIDFQRDGREDVQPNINNKGMVTTDRVPKDVYYLYKSRWSKDPFIHITGKNWTQRFYFSESVVVNDTIIVYSNLTGIQLFNNGVRQNLINSSNGKFRFAVSFRSGKNNLLSKTVDNNITDVLNVSTDIISMKNFSTQLPADQLCFNTGQTRTFYSNRSKSEHWLPDKTYSPGTWGYIGGEVYRSWKGNKSWDGIREGIHKPVYLTDDEPLFQTFVEGLTEWKADIPPGKYRVSLYVCEPFTSEQRNGKTRQMSITINNEEWIKELDMEKQYGVLTALVLDKELIVQGNGLSIHFVSRSGKTILNGIKIQKLN